MICPICEKDSLIEVSRVYSVPFYACHNKECENEAELVLNVGTEENPAFVRYFEMIEAMNSMAETGLMKEETHLLLSPSGNY